MSHIAELDAQNKELESMRNALKTLAHHCHGDARPDYSILDEFVSEGRP